MVRTVLMGPPRTAAWWAAALVTLALVAPPAVAQTPSQGQIDALKSLPADQQQQLLQEFGLAGAIPTVPQPSATTTPTMQPKDIPIGIPLPAGPQVELEPRFRAGDSLLLDVTEAIGPQSPLAPPPMTPLTPPPLSATAPVVINRTFVEFQQRLRGGNPYRLDRAGRLLLPGQIAIPLAGLSVEEAEERLNADPRLEAMAFHLRYLPVEPELKPFGYDLFTMVPTTYAQASDIPVPSSYVIGPGDTIELQLIGDSAGYYQLVVGRDGTVNLPSLGPVAVAGLGYDLAKARIEDQVASQMIGTRAHVSVGALRSIQVFVLGEATRPGAYTVSGLSTMTNALFASGGVKEIGSLRRIQLKRGGQLVKELDLYDMLLHGDTSGDSRLMSGDVIFIPPVGATVAATGEVRRPAIYELKPNETAAALLRFAGGLTPEADARTARIERIANQRERTSVTLDLATNEGLAAALTSGDRVQVDSIRDRMEGSVALMGEVHRAGLLQYRPGMRLTDLVGSLDELKPLADTHYVLVRRETGPTRILSAVSADLAAAFAAPGSEADLLLQARDTVYVFDLASSRERVIQPLLKELERQSAAREPQQVVTVTGSVKVPGSYPLEPGMTVSDLLRAGGGLDQAAFGGQAELTRHQVAGGMRRESTLQSVDIAAALAGDPAADVPLLAFDQLVVKEMPEWDEVETISILGEVRFPGEYPIRRGETLRQVVERAGGLTDLAFKSGTVFTRLELKEREQRQLQLLAERLQRDLASLSLEQAASGEAGAAQAVSAGQQLLTELQATQAVGRLVINLDAVLNAAPGSTEDLIVRNGDALYIPRLAQEVMVLGEVQNATSHLYNADLTRDDYIRLSGGVTQRAAVKRTFIVRADGSVSSGESSSWMSRGTPTEVHQGDTIVVPLDADRVRPLSLWTSVTQIIYHLAVAVAAVGRI
jgi:protein involved in polysaccharide export with SLBB domain